jgi:hypothetical protein
MKAKIFKLPENSVLIEKYEGDKLIRRVAWPAMLYSTYADKEKLITVSSVSLRNFDTFSVAPQDLEIDGVPQTDGHAAAVELNGFIGNYSHGGSGGGISVDDIKDVVQNIVREEIRDVVQDAMQDVLEEGIEFETEEI